jgi:molecular chaperone DnaK
VAQGAAIHAAILEARQTGGQSRLAQTVIRRLSSVTAIDVNSHALGVEVTDTQNRKTKYNHVMIPRNTAIPHTVTQKFTTTSSNQQRIHVRILQGEVQAIDACTIIGDFRITDLPPNLPAGSPVEVTYAYESNGRIVASAKELTKNREAKIEIVRDSGLNDNGLEAFEKLAREYIVE